MMTAIRRVMRTRLCGEHWRLWSYACRECQQRRYR